MTDFFWSAQQMLIVHILSRIPVLQKRLRCVIHFSGPKNLHRLLINKREHAYLPHSAMLFWLGKVMDSYLKPGLAIA